MPLKLNQSLIKEKASKDAPTNLPDDMVPKLDQQLQPDVLGDKAWYIQKSVKCNLPFHTFSRAIPFHRGQPVPDLEHYMESLASKSRTIEKYVENANEELEGTPQRDELFA